MFALLYPEQSVTFLSQNFDFWIAGEFLVICSMAAFVNIGPSPATKRTRTQLLAFFAVMMIAPIVIFQQWILGAFMLVNLVIRALATRFVTECVKSTIGVNALVVLASFFFAILLSDIWIEIVDGVFWVALYYGLLTVVGVVSLLRRTVRA